MAIDIKKVPKELLEKREMVECNFIFSLYQDIDLFHDYRHVKPEEDIITEDGQYYYTLGIAMVNAGYQTLDGMSFVTFLEDNKDLKKGFEQRGGYKTIQEIEAVVSVDNVDTYYDELCRSNMLIHLHNQGFNVIKNLNTFKEMTSDQVYDWFEYQLANTVVSKVEKIKVEDLSDGYDEWIDRISAGKNMGYKVGSGMMDYKLGGIHKGLTLYAGGIGQGKSSSSVPLFILPAIEHGNDICIICNEQTSDEYRSMIIATVLFNKLSGVRGMNRMTLTLGNFDKEKEDYLKEAAAWIKKQPGKIKFVELESYNAINVRKIIKKQAKLGCGYFIFDVLKSVNDADDKAWAVLSDTAKMLSNLGKNEDIAIIATVQLASDSMFRKFLDITAIGKSRAMAECATTVIGFRPIMNDEIDKIKPYKWKKKDNGDNKKEKIVIDLDPEKHYIMQFIMKNRWGDVNEQIVQEFNQDFNTLSDVGYYRASYDNFRRAK